jgi:endonuclease YncB( thermonuclease family)
VRLIVLVGAFLLFNLAAAHPGGLDNAGCHRDSETGERHCHSHRAARDAELARFSSENPPKAGDEGVFYGPVLRIIDGDTFEARVQGVVMDFRLEGVDAPERDQPYGDKATAALREILEGQQVVMIPSDTTPTYGRTVVRVWRGALEVNLEMVVRGLAWFDSRYSRDASLYDEESRARDQKRGVWSLPLEQRVEPWVWRKEKR